MDSFIFEDLKGLVRDSSLIIITHGKKSLLGMHLGPVESSVRIFSKTLRESRLLSNVIDIGR